MDKQSDNVVRSVMANRYFLILFIYFLSILRFEIPLIAAVLIRSFAYYYNYYFLFTCLISMPQMIIFIISCSFYTDTDAIRLEI